jgi:hypothetical protein
VEPKSNDRKKFVPSPDWVQARERAQSDPELARTLEAAEKVMQENWDVLRRLADS